MTTAEIKKELRSLGYSEKLIVSGVEKAKRWMKAAYGRVDWQELETEAGDPVGYVIGFIKETEEKPDGIKTFNRGNYT